jgi:putative SOS response-associated peptidase YedK
LRRNGDDIATAALRGADTGMPVLLMTPADVERWLEGTPEEALELQKPAPDDAIVMDPALEKRAA